MSFSPSNSRDVVMNYKVSNVEKRRQEGEVPPPRETNDTHTEREQKKNNTVHLSLKNFV